MKILLATRNRNKVEEIRSIFDVKDLEFVDLGDYPHIPEVVEDRDSFEGNSAKKATELAGATGLLAIADDSGLEVPTLDYEPGVCSARYSGIHGDDAANNEKLLRRLEDKDDRSARFRCVITLAKPDGNLSSVEGVCQGDIAMNPAGKNGFGYDPIFIPEGHTKTFAEIDPSTKNRISHRAKALQMARSRWIRDGKVDINLLTIDT